MKVPFQAKDEFKASCTREGLTPLWDPELKLWAIEDLNADDATPASLTKWDMPADEKDQKFWVIDCDYGYYPFAARAGARWDATLKSCVFQGAKLPMELTGFEPAPFSLQERIEHQLNGIVPKPTPPGKDVTFHLHQTEGVAQIKAAHNAGAPGFLLADSTGLGKTLTVWQAILEISKKAKTPLRIIIIGPLGAMAAWREAIEWLGSGGTNRANDITLINYDRLKHLFEAEGETRNKKTGKTKPKSRAKTLKGVATFQSAEPCDILVYDESHYLKTPTAARTKLARALEKKAKFLIWMSATAGQNPLELSYLSSLLAFSTGEKKTEVEKDYEQWCQFQGIRLQRGKFGRWDWEGGAEDNAIIHKLLFKRKSPPIALRRRCSDIEGWPELQRIPRPYEFNRQQREAYEAEWQAFLLAYEADKLDRLAGKKDVSKGIAQLTRLRQKGSLLRVEQTVNLTEELLEEGRQVAISVEYLGTLNALRDALEKKKYKVGEYSGQNTSLREDVRRAYQDGKIDVIIFTVEAAISLHKEKDEDKERAQINHDLRWSSIPQEQVDGRSHRNGRHAPVYWCFAKDTIEERVATIMLQKMKGMDVFRGDENDFSEILAAITSEK